MTHPAPRNAGSLLAVPLVLAIWACNSLSGPDSRIAALEGTWAEVECSIVEDGGSNRVEPCILSLLLSIDASGHFVNTQMPLPGEDPVTIPFEGDLKAGKGFLVAILEPAGTRWIVTAAAGSEMRWVTTGDWRFQSGDPTPMPATFHTRFLRQ